MTDPVKLTVVEAPGDGVKTLWDFNFAGAAGTPGYISQDHVKAFLTVVATQVRTDVPVTPGMFVGPTTLEVLPAVPVGTTLTIYRDTPKDKPLVDFTTTAILNEQNLDKVSRQAIYVSAEMVDQFLEAHESAEAAVAAAADANTSALASASSATSSAAAATSASNSATAASGSASAAGTAAASASASASAAAASYDSFDDRYLGPKASDPTVDNDGNPLLDGALYWHTSGIMKAYYLAGTVWRTTMDFLQAGVGAVVRAVQDKLRETPSVKDFGATGNGTTDDSAAIQAAVNAGGRIFIPPGNYLINTGISLPSQSELVFAPNAKFLAGANSMWVLYTTGGLKSSVKLRNASISGNGHTGVTGIRYQNVQFDSFIENPNIELCATGITLTNTCIGVVIDKPTIYRTPDGLQILNSNANTVISPNIDNITAVGGSGTGTGIFLGTGGIAAPSSNTVVGGFIQGFDNGVYDQGYANGIDTVYFEQCNEAAYKGVGAIGTVVSNIQFFGAAGTNYAIKLTGCRGVQVLYPKHVKTGGSGAIYNADGSNSNCTQVYTTDGGTSNTTVGTITGFNTLPVESKVTSFTPSVEGTTTTGTATYSVRRGTRRTIGNRVDFTINLAWSGHTGTGNLIIPGLDVGADSVLYADESFVTVTSGFAVTGPILRGYFSSAVPYIQIQQVATSGSAANLALPASGAVSISGSYWKA